MSRDVVYFYRVFCLTRYSLSWFKYNIILINDLRLSSATNKGSCNNSQRFGSQKSIGILPGYLAQLCCISMQHIQIYRRIPKTSIMKPSIKSRWIRNSCLIRNKKSNITKKRVIIYYSFVYHLFVIYVYIVTLWKIIIHM